MISSNKKTVFSILIVIIFLINCASEEAQMKYKFVKLDEINLNFPEGGIVGKIFDFAEHNNEYYLVDQLSHTIWVTDINGGLKRKIGRKGRGPGDLFAPVSIAFKGDTLLVLEKDNARVSFFNKSGVYIRQFRVRGGLLSSLEVSNNGVRIIIGESLGIWGYLFYSINGELLSDSPGLKRTEILMPTSISGGQLSLTNKDHILFSGIKDYNIVLLNWQGDTLNYYCAAPDDYLAPNLNDGEKLRKQKFWSIITLPLEVNNLIMVQRFNKVLTANNKAGKEKNRFYFDLFSLDGKQIVDGLTCDCPQFIYQKDGLLYSIDYSPIEEGKENPSILVFELRSDYKQE